MTYSCDKRRETQTCKEEGMKERGRAFSILLVNIIHSFDVCHFNENSVLSVELINYRNMLTALCAECTRRKLNVSSPLSFSPSSPVNGSVSFNTYSIIVMSYQNQVI